MEILKGAITSLASEGRITLQVPQCDIIFSGGKKSEVEEIPDDWIMEIRHGSPTVGKERGYLFLTRKGWNANKEAIKEAFESALYPRGTWEEFEKEAEEHFENVVKAIQKRIDLMQSKIDALKESREII